MRTLDQLPPFSPVMSKLMASMANDDASFAHLAAMIERDTVLSGNVLRLVNSALYGRRGTVSSVRAAVSILGLTKLRNFVLGFSVSQVLARVKAPSVWDMGRFNTHSAAVAVLADQIVQRGRIDYPEGAFAAGLLHDLGKLMIATSLPDEYRAVLDGAAQSGRPEEDVELERLDTTHSELSAAALARWGLPVPIQKAVLYHHRSADDPMMGERQSLPLSAAVEAADNIADALGHGLSPQPPPDAGVPEALRRIGMEGEESRILANFEAEFAAMRSHG